MRIDITEGEGIAIVHMKTDADEEVVPDLVIAEEKVVSEGVVRGLDRRLIPLDSGRDPDLVTDGTGIETSEHPLIGKAIGFVC